MLELIESDFYYFDEEAAARAVNFCHRYLKHYEDKWAGEPFILLEWEIKVVRDLFGWKRRDNDHRRFKEAYIEIAKGNGKSPLLAAIGCYMLLADNEEGPHVISAATDQQQAGVTFDSGKKMLQASDRLARLVNITEFEITAPKNGRWTIVSGGAGGKAGMRPTCVLMDEAWEWPNRKLYDSITRNAKKRSQSLVVIATNAGTSRDTICWELHERARRVIVGESKDDTLYPVIYAAGDKEDAGDPKIWAKANPALDQIITTETLQSEWVKAQEVPALEAEFRRLHLSQWVQGASKWLDMSAWDAATQPFTLAEVAEFPLVSAIDMSLNDDLTALADIWIGPQRLYARCKFWLPMKTAIEYEQQASIPFTQWAREGFINLITSDTIDPRMQARLAKLIISRKAKFKNFKGLAYDRNRASNVIARCEKAGVVCIPVPQNWALSPAAEELSRRLKDKTIQLQPNPVLRWNAANCEATHDKNGNIHIGKEGRKGQYAGRRGSKIDGVAAMITGLSQVLRELMQPPKEPSVYESRGVFVLD